MGVLLVTHDPRAAAFADHVHALRDGRLVAYEPERVYAPFDAE
jgi:ABC-type lipoprotein export system ATPase subunit